MRVRMCGEQLSPSKTSGCFFELLTTALVPAPRTTQRKSGRTTSRNPAAGCLILVQARGRINEKRQNEIQGDVDEGSFTLARAGLAMPATCRLQSCPELETARSGRTLGASGHAGNGLAFPRMQRDRFKRSGRHQRCALESDRGRVSAARRCRQTYARRPTALMLRGLGAAEITPWDRAVRRHSRAGLPDEAPRGFARWDSRGVAKPWLVVLARDR